MDWWDDDSSVSATQKGDISENSSAMGSVQLFHSVEIKKDQIDKPQILLVDDQKYNLDALEIIMEYHIKLNPSICKTALDGNQALDAIIQNVKKNNNEKCDFKLIMMDVNMPFMDGYEATSRIRDLIYREGLL